MKGAPTRLTPRGRVVVAAVYVTAFLVGMNIPGEWWVR